MEVLYARRDSPEIMLPVANAAVGVGSVSNLGTSWALGSYNTLVSVANFKRPYLVVGAYLSMRFSKNVSGAALNTTANITRRAQVQLFYTLPGGSRTKFATLPWCQSGTVSSGGNTDGVTVITLAATNTRRHNIGRYHFPAGTLIEMNGAVGDAGYSGTDDLVYRMELIAYEQETYQRVAIPRRGWEWYGGMNAPDLSHSSNRDLVCFPELGDIQLTPVQTWVTVQDPLDDDYLIEGFMWSTSDGVQAGSGIELALGAAGMEVTQARAQAGRGSTFFAYASDQVFEEPFIAYKGERLSARVLTLSNVSGEIMIYGRRA